MSVQSLVPTDPETFKIVRTQVRRICGNNVDVEDVVQQILLFFWSHGKTFISRKLITIFCWRELRKKRRRLEIEREGAKKEVQPPAQSVEEEEKEGEERREKLFSLLKRLSIPEELVVRKRILDEKTFPEIAEELGISRFKAMRILNRALEVLAGMWAEKERTA
jgi:RNA polymerase sigma factor (sigma-70 family)